MKHLPNKILQTTLLASGLLLLNACGGGGGSKTSAATQQPTGTDTTAPVITLKGDATMRIVETNTYSEPGATAIDAVDGKVTVAVSGNVDTTKVGTYTITYTAQDSQKNTAKQTRSIEVVAAKVLTNTRPHTHSNCKGNIEDTGKDYNNNGQLDAKEITATTPNYEEGTPVTLADLKSKIANGEDVTKVNTCEITDMSGLFQDNLTFNQDIGGWNTGSVTNMSSMFSRAIDFNQDIGGWNTHAVTNMSYMFADATAFNQSLDWDTSAVTNMNSMFHSAASFNQTLDWETGAVTDMSDMFYSATSFNQSLVWDTASVTNMSGMFSGATAFNQSLDWDTSAVTDMSYMFYGAIKNTNPGANKWDFSSIKKGGLVSMFTDVMLGDEARVFLLDNWLTQVTDGKILQKLKVDIGEFSYDANNPVHRTTMGYISVLMQGKGWTVGYSIN